MGAECTQQFGQVPQQVFHEDNSIIHVGGDYEGDPSRRPLTYDEVQALFDAADARVGLIRSRGGRKGAMTALRDAAMLKFCYAYGLRRSEVVHSDVVDLRRNSKMDEFGRFGALSVRYGKASRGRRTQAAHCVNGSGDELDRRCSRSLSHRGAPTVSRGQQPGVVVDRAGAPESARACSMWRSRPYAMSPASIRLWICTRCVIPLSPIWWSLTIRSDLSRSKSGIRSPRRLRSTSGVSNEYRNRLISQSMQSRYGHHFDRGGRDEADGLRVASAHEDG